MFSLLRSSFKYLALSLTLGFACLSVPAASQNGDRPDNSADTSSGNYREPYYDRSKYEQYLPLALYLTGENLEESEAYGYMRAAAEKGFAKAQLWMGDYYFKHKDYKKAGHWYNKAAVQGNVEAERKLTASIKHRARILNDQPENSAETSNDRKDKYKVLGFKAPDTNSRNSDESAENKNYVQRGKSAYEQRQFSQALEYYKKAAEQGNPEAQYSLGKMYYFGQGTNKNFNAALHWFTKAAEQGNAEAKNYIAEIDKLELGNDVGVAYDDQPIEHSASTNTALKKNYQTNSSDTLTVYADIYQNTSQYDGLKPYDAYTQGAAAISKGQAKGYALLKSSARRGCNQAKLALANLFLPIKHPLKWEDTYTLSLEGKTLDDKERMQRYLKWMNSAAENGSSTAAKDLAKLYREGKHVGKDANQIFKYTKLAALAKEPEYMYRLGTYYAQGLGCQKDRASAVKWVKQAAHLGSSEAKQWIEDRRGRYEVKEFGHNAGSYEIMNSYGYSYTAAYFRSGINGYFQPNYYGTVNRLTKLKNGSASAGGLKSFEVVGILKGGSLNSEFFSITDKNGERLDLCETRRCPSSRQYNGQVVRCVVYPFPSEFAICSDIYPCSSYIKDGTKKQYIPPKVKGWEDLL